ncbi:protein phosphatase [Enterovibrio norvegicus FF-33]|uniref:Protein phosphatase CheZ n=1 Tax=Enterovibrio norvegicus FF-454 TaxID=1185651 RepID=A0A1E5C696_9GAMM|nr:protein phosphatase CheZ [Enterovibrio norvegicus]OEE61044.1 protein phosphatase [Enterovibrio norvegicus FF-454]OEE68157.1 protein phosphatase [Enterovibrio norvegicus FF-33]OEE78257.1 protein phosphatase [Enterovibrio norvegicus FF-162]
MITLDQAKELVSLLEEGNQEGANELLAKLTGDPRNPLFNEVGKLTRQLHDSLSNFRLDPRVNDLATSEIPDAKDRLNFVMEKTEIAANRTMDAVEATLPIADNLQDCLSQVRPQWNNLMGGRIDLLNFKELCHQIDGLLTQVEGDTTKLHSQLTEILMAQDFQDITGQVIRRVIDLVQEVEKQLVEILTAFGLDDEQEQIEPETVQQSGIEAEGPVVTEEQRQEKNVMQSQDDVDDLLSSLGF